MAGKVYSHMTMSMDGFIADPADGAEELFGWYNAGQTQVSAAEGRYTFDVDDNSAEFLRAMTAEAGALVCGRRLFDLTHGWDDHHPLGTPVVVVTHQPPADVSPWPDTTFVDGIADAVERARQIANGKDVSIASASVASQALDLGLLDEYRISLAPVALGRGIPYLSGLTAAPHRFDDPTVILGVRALHLIYPVRHEEGQR